MSKKIMFLSIAFILVFLPTRVNANEDSLLTNLINQRKDCVCLITNRGKIALGAGLLTYFTGPKGTILAGVITNKHVIEGVDSLYVRVNSRTGVQDIYAFPVAEKFIPKDVDLVLLFPNLTEQQILEWENTEPLGRDKLVGADSIKEGDRLFYIGFPLGLGVGEKNQPLVRFGYVSQKVKGRKSFLMDGFASHGNSGSPVFSTKNGKLVGMIMAFKPDFIDAQNPKEGLMIQLPYNAGITEVITADEIARIVMDLIPTLEKLREELKKNVK